MKSSSRRSVARVALLLLASSTLACSTTRGESASEARAPRAASASTVEAAYAPEAPQAERQLDPVSLELWQSDAFRRRFTESYAAEIDVEPSVTEDEREELQEIFERISADDIDAAMAALAKRGGKASSAVFDFTLASLHFQREELDSAAPLYRTAIDKHPRFRRAWKNLGLVQFRQGAFADAGESFARVVELGGGDAVTYGLLGFAHASLGRHVAAESAYRMAMLLDPTTLDWQMGLARSFFEQQRFADAVALCDALLAGQPERADLWLLQANAYIGLQRPADAVANYEVVDRLGHATAATLSMQGDIYVNEGLFDLAVACYGRALGHADAPVDRVVRAAKVLSARGASDATRTLVTRIEEVRGEELGSTDRKELLKLRARLAVADGAGDEEARVLEEIVALDPLDGEALILLGKHAARTGDADGAIFQFERAAQLEAFEADAKVAHAQVLVGRGDHAGALPLLRRAQTLTPRENVQDYLEQVERIARGR